MISQSKLSIPKVTLKIPLIMHISKLSQYFPVGQKPCLSYTREKNKNGKTFLNKSWPRSGNNSNLSQNFVKGFVCCLRQEQESIFIKLLSKLPFTNKKKRHWYWIIRIYNKWNLSQSTNNLIILHFMEIDISSCFKAYSHYAQVYVFSQWQTEINGWRMRTIRSSQTQ